MGPAGGSRRSRGTGTGSGTTTSGERLAYADELAALSHEHILRERVVVGGAAALVKRLRQLRNHLIPMENMMRSLRILAEDIAPALR